MYVDTRGDERGMVEKVLECREPIFLGSYVFVMLPWFVFLHSYYCNSNYTSFLFISVHRLSHKGVAGRHSCDVCAAGTFAQGLGNSSCGACEVGKTSSAGDSECDNDCAAGTYLGLGVQCLQCGVGRFSVPGSTSCNACEAGR
jgi:hypothetical protein